MEGKMSFPVFVAQRETIKCSADIVNLKLYRLSTKLYLLFTIIQSSTSYLLVIQYRLFSPTVTSCGRLLCRDDSSCNTSTKELTLYRNSRSFSLA